MKFHSLTLAALLIVSGGCAHDGGQVLSKGEYHAPPAQQLAHPGPMVGGPGPGVMGMHAIQQASFTQPGGGPAAGGYCPPGGYAPGGPYAGPTRKTQVRFVGPEGVSIGWQIGDGFADNQLTAPGRYDFVQGATYRLKLTNIPGRAGTVLYPTLQVYPAHPLTDAYLAHNSVPLRLTDEDLDQVETNNFVTKVIYLPEEKYEQFAIAGVEELVSTRLDPGLDPVSEADRRGTIMAVLRVGNKDYEMPTDDGMMMGALTTEGEVMPVSHVVQVDGEQGQFVPPLPIDGGGVGYAIPTDIIVGGPAGPGQPPYNPIVGVGGAPSYGQPQSATPIGLVGPPHIPYGRPASLRSHTMRNLTNVDVGEPVKDLLIDVKHNPGISLPYPVKHIEYEETHPVYSPGEISWPAGAGGAPGAGGGYYPTR